MARGRGESADKRTEAISLGQPTYLGKPCVNGHQGVRYSSCRMCVDCAQARKRNPKPEHWKKWDKLNPEKRYAAVRSWQKRNPEKYREAQRLSEQTRRARKREAQGSFTVQESTDLFAMQDGCCAYCQSSENMSLDHKTPLSRGGSNSIENLQWLCVSCNSRKRTRTDEEYRAVAGITSIK